MKPISETMKRLPKNYQLQETTKKPIIAKRVQTFSYCIITHIMTHLRVVILHSDDLASTLPGVLDNGFFIQRFHSERIQNTGADATERFQIFGGVQGLLQCHSSSNNQDLQKKNLKNCVYCKRKFFKTTFQKLWQMIVNRPSESIQSGYKKWPLAVALKVQT